MQAPVPVQQLILEYCDLDTLLNTSLVSKEWCEKSSMIRAKKLYGGLALVSSYDNRWRDLIIDKNSRNKPKVFQTVLI